MRRDESAALRRWMYGFSEGYDPKMLYVATLSNHSWEQAEVKGDCSLLDKIKYSSGVQRSWAYSTVINNKKQLKIYRSEGNDLNFGQDVSTLWPSKLSSRSIHWNSHTGGCGTMV